MGEKALINDSLLMSSLLSKGINYKDYNYNSSFENEIDTEEFRQKKPFIIKNKKFYNNPFLWELILEKPYDDIISSILLLHIGELDEPILSTIIQNPNTKLSVVKKVLTAVYDKYIGLNRPFQIEDLMLDAVNANQLERLKVLVDFAIENDIKPTCGSFGNIRNGSAFNEAVKYSSLDLVKYMMELGATADCYDNWPFYNALKHGKYAIAKYLMDNGADPHQRETVGKIAFKKSLSEDLTEEDKLALPYFKALYSV